MATYAELLSMIDNEALFNKIRVAVWVAADTIRAEVDTTPNHAARVAWAKSAFANPDGAARILMPAVLAQNKAADLATITAATDAQVQAAVDAAVNTIA
jgi:hypothetical protein